MIKMNEIKLIKISNGYGNGKRILDNEKKGKKKLKVLRRYKRVGKEGEKKIWRAASLEEN